MYMAHLGGGELLIGLLLGVSAMAEVPIMHYGGWLMRRLGANQALMLGLGFFGAAYFCGFFAREPWQLLISGALNGAGFGLSFVAILVTFDRHAPDNWSASVQALVSAGMFGFAPFATAIVFGAIFDIWPAGIYAFSAVLTVAAILCTWTAIRLEKKTV
jgi:MFS family permease